MIIIFPTRGLLLLRLPMLSVMVLVLGSDVLAWKTRGSPRRESWSMASPGAAAGL